LPGVHSIRFYPLFILVPFGRLPGGMMFRGYYRFHIVPELLICSWYSSLSFRMTKE
jgi:hypothetical protein